MAFNVLDMDQRTADWDAFRQHHIGSTDAAPIMGESKYKSRAVLLRQKLGLEPPEPVNDLMREGIALEPHARQAYERRRGLRYEPRVLQSQSSAWQVASVDGITTCRTRLVEIKCGKGTYWQTKKNGEPCKHYYAQVQHILCVTGLSSIDYFVYRPELEPILLTVNRDPEYILRLTKAESEFYSELSQKLIAIGQRPKYSVTSSGVTNGDSAYKPVAISTTTTAVHSNESRKTVKNSASHAKKIRKSSSEPVISFEEKHYSDGRYVGETKNGLRHGTGSFAWTSGGKYVGEWKDDKRCGQGTNTWGDRSQWAGHKYIGEWKDGNMHGQGTYTAPNGYKYVGEWKDHKKNGKGDCTYSDGGRYVGEWKDNNRHGKGDCTYPNGDRYVGEWKDNNRHGKGDCTYSDGKGYVGEWKDDKRSGQGTLTWSDGSQGAGHKYVGEWKDDRKYGQGTYTWPNGDKYVGEWKDGNKHGQGTYTMPNGYKYVGEYKDDKQNGKGDCFYSDGGRYVGEWKDDKQCGQGTCTWGDRSQWAGHKYIGEWKDGNMHGQGTYTAPNGYKYVGEWKDHKKNGKGDCSYSDGGRYVGEWKDGNRHGQGTFNWPDGSTHSGKFREDALCGKGELTYADGRIFTADFSSVPLVGRSPPAPLSGWKNLSEHRRLYGSTSWLDGRKYVGDLKNNMPHGHGTMTWPNGQKFTGEFKDGKKHGDGVIELPNGDKILGKWIADQPLKTRHHTPPQPKVRDFYVAGQAWAELLNKRQRDHFVEWYEFSDASELPESIDDACLDKNALKKLKAAYGEGEITKNRLLKFIKGAGDFIDEQP